MGPFTVIEKKNAVWIVQGNCENRQKIRLNSIQMELLVARLESAKENMKLKLVRKSRTIGKDTSE